VLAQAPKAPAGPSVHDLAVAAFEKGFQALQAREFGRAAKLLAAVVDDYPDEKELQERARVYLSICERRVAAGERRKPQSLEESINEATVALNRGETSQGLALLRKLETERGDHDHVQYMLSVAYTLLGDFPQALEHLKQAVALNHENRYLATQDADLDPLRHDPGFPAALETPSVRPKPLSKKR
jgi:tetratricopeptide (TPR) repeat protein